MAGVQTSGLAGFSEATRAWFDSAFAEPTPAQAQAWEAIGRGEHTLVIAPTGSGKTLAAFLWAIDRLAREPVPADPKRRCRVLYVSPLKALAVDVERNLRSPLAGVSHAARRLGQPEPDIRVAVRTGDTAADERRKLVSKPPDILITTPESLFLMLTSQARDGLRSVQTVIIDEVHALAGGKRGAHLALSLERLEVLRGSLAVTGEPAVQPVQRIGLSATVRPPEEVATFLAGARPVTIVAPPSQKRLDLQIVVPVEDMADMQTAGGPGGSSPRAIAGGQPRPQRVPMADGRVVSAATARSERPPADEDLRPPGRLSEPDGDPARQHSIWPHVEERVLDLIQSHRSTIVFANSRRLAERLCARLNDLAAERAAAAGQDGSDEYEPRSPMIRDAGTGPPAELMGQAGAATGAPPVVARAHHGSVSRQERGRDLEPGARHRHGRG
jgi:ATP-dependent helicase Lhr and Lhr-like helicase